MAKIKSDEKRLAVQKPAPVSVKKYGTATITLQLGNPVISFSGEWSMRDLKNILRAIPRAYRLHQISRRKQGEGRFINEETQHA
jgi:hypothetical protein